MNIYGFGHWFGVKNIVVLLLDTARASDVNSNRRLATISGLARKGTAYMNAIAPGTWTAPTHASLFTDQRVSSIRHVSQDFFHNGTYKIDPWMVKTKFLGSDSVTIAQKVRELGHYSVMFSNNPFLSSFTNLAMGFNKVYDTWLTSNLKYNKSLAGRLSFIVNGGATARSLMFHTSSLLTRVLPNRVLDSLYLRLRHRLSDGIAKADGTHMLDRGARDANKALRNYLTYDYNYKPNFMFINYIEAHENYPVSSSSEVVQDKWLYLSGIEDMDEDATGKLHSGYLKRIEYLDRAVKEALRILKERGILDDATVVITSDHGQFFGEHGMLYHSMPPYQEVTHVPLIAANYENGKIVTANDRVGKPVSLLALHRALLNLASGKEQRLNGNLRSSRYVLSEHTGICEGWDESLLRMLKPRSASAALIYKAKSRFNMKATAVYKGNMKLIHYFGRRRDELYNLAEDPSESSNIMDSNRALANELARQAA